MRNQLLGLSAAVAVAALGTNTARADHKPTLGTLAISLPNAHTTTVETLQAMGTQGALRSDRFDGQDLVDRIDVGGAAARAEARRKAGAKFQAGREAYDSLDLDKAVQYFAEAADLYRTADLRRSFDDYLQACVWHAASRYLNGDKAGAQHDFSKIFVLAPRAVIDKQLFPPDLLATAERSRAEVEAEATINLQVSATPPGLAWVDGHLAGATPVTVGRVPTGEHLVVVAAPGEQLAVTTTAGTQVRVNLTRAGGRDDFEAVRSRAAAAFFGTNRTPELAAAARSLGVDQLLVVAYEGAKSPVLHLLRVTADGRALAGAEGNAGADAVQELNRLLPAVLAKDAPEAAQRALISSEQRNGQGSGGVNVPALAPWLGLGALVLAGGSTAFALIANTHRNDFERTPQINTQASAAQASATKRTALVADVLGVSAGVVALTAASVYFAPGLWGWHAPASSELAPDKAKPVDKGEEDLRESLRLAPSFFSGGAGVVALAQF